jgi:ComF family protein
MVFPKKIWNVMMLPGVLKTNFVSFFDFFLPRFCVSCSTKLNPSEDSFCVNCLNKIEIASAERINHEFERKFKDDKIISDFFSLFVFEKDGELQHGIHALKYSNRFKVGIFLGVLLGRKVRELNQIWKIDFVIPIPLHHLKKAERGYNQSYYIAKGVNLILNCKLKENAVKRVKYTESQTTMNLSERKENIAEAFKVRRMKTLQGKNILLIDDVITTGATITECGNILLESGANKIYAASVAIAD